MIQALAPSFNFPRTTIGDGTDHVRPATLRGLSPDQALVLVNGKRRHASALVNINGFVGRGSEAVDLNAIPASMIDHIEILRDGAAAQYGSDAIAGVINIVLKTTRRATFTRASRRELNEGTRQVANVHHRHATSTTASCSTRTPIMVGSSARTAISSSAARVRDRGYTNRAAPDTRAQYFTGEPDAIRICRCPVESISRSAIHTSTTTTASECRHDVRPTASQLYAFGGLWPPLRRRVRLLAPPERRRTVRAVYPERIPAVDEQPIVWTARATSA